MTDKSQGAKDPACGQSHSTELLERFECRSSDLWWQFAQREDRMWAEYGDKWRALSGSTETQERLYEQYQRKQRALHAAHTRLHNKLCLTMLSNT